MVLAAGFGTRMRPLTDHQPKPLIVVNGKPILEWILERVAEEGASPVVLNASYHAGHIEAFAHTHPLHPLVCWEETPLETGGGVANALPLLGTANPFFVINGDSLWLNGTMPALARLRHAWDDARMDALLLLCRSVNAHGYEGLGDFHLSALGHLQRRAATDLAPFVFMGVQLLHPRLFQGCPPGAFSLNHLYNNAIKTGRLHGLVHDGEWFHLSTPTDITLTEQRLRHGR
jgi:N-acetyl-alpha-D-muramate 1-phosphate uridylyltransferase